MVITGPVRAVLDDFDAMVALAFALGLGIGAIWLAWTGPGVVVASLLFGLGAMILTIRRRWLEFGAFLLGTGIVPTVGYRILGPPPVQPTQVEGVVPIEVIAPSAASLLIIVGLTLVGVMTAHRIREEKRRATHVERRADRKRRIMNTERP
jgi:hypothetical protein